jgi:hypothetical protein
MFTESHKGSPTLTNYLSQSKQLECDDPNWIDLFGISFAMIVSPSVYDSRTAERISRNYILGSFTKICLHIKIFVKLGRQQQQQQQRTL